MANVNGVIGFNPFTDTSRLLAAYGNDIVNLATGLGYSLNLDGTSKVEFEKFLDRVFMQDYTARPKTYRSDTNKWVNDHVGRTPRSKYIKKYHSRLYLGYCRFVGAQQPLDPNTDGDNIQFPSRVFYSDLFSGPDLTWGVEWGRNGLVYPGTNIFYLQTSGTNYPLEQDFISRNIKVGDPLIILDSDTPGADRELNKTHLVTKVDSAYRLHLNTTFTGLSNGALIDYWVGSNWFDVEPDDGDSIAGFGENSDRLLIFKLLSLWFYTGTQLKKVQGALGTSSNRSIINDNRGSTYYFHGSDPKLSGIYRYDGVSSTLISRAIDPFIRGMAASNYSLVTAWQEGAKLRWFLGDLTNTNYSISMTNVVATYNTLTGSWSVDPIADVIKCATSWIVSSTQNTYLGTSDDEVLKMDSGNDFNGTPINARLETKIYYPGGSEVISDFPYVQVIGRNVKGVKVKYKLYNMPKGNDDEYQALGELDNDKTEFILPVAHYAASGIQFLFEEIGTLENDSLIEKITVFYRPDRTRLL